MKYLVDNPVVIHLAANAVYTVVARHTKTTDQKRIDTLHITGIGIAKTDAFVAGKIVHRDRLITAIKKSISDAEEMANMRIHSVTLCFSTPELISDNRLGRAEVLGDATTNDDMARALQVAKQSFHQADEYLVQFCPLMMWLGEEEGTRQVRDALGMTGIDYIQAGYHLMSLPSRQVNEMHQVFKDCGVSVDHTVFGMVAGAEYALMKEERERGVIFIDIGRDLVNVVVYNENILIFSKCFDVGAHLVTQDISAQLGIPLKEAERLKCHEATLQLTADMKSKFIPQGHDEGVVSQMALCQIAQVRYDLIFDSIMTAINEAQLGREFFEAGVVLSGGGSLIKGLVPYLRKRWGVPVHLTSTPPVELAIYTKGLRNSSIRQLSTLINQRQLHTAFGAMIYHLSDDFDYQQRLSHAEDDAEGLFGSMSEKVSSWWRSSWMGKRL
ncbi:MAG: cell division protein FtsA [Moraxella sp.]|nr:cell division protein FtsA [Moraxella sp.]